MEVNMKVQKVPFLSALAVRNRPVLLISAFVLLFCFPQTAVAQSCSAPFCASVDAQAALTQPQTVTLSGTNLAGTGGQAVCASPANVNVSGSSTGLGNRTTFKLFVTNATPTFYQTYFSRLTLDVTWTPASGLASTSDLELLFDGFANQSDNSDPHEQLVLDNVSSAGPNSDGSHTITVCDVLVAVPQPFTLKITLQSQATPFPQPSLPAAPVANVTPPRYQNFTPAQDQIAAGMSKNSSDEPSIGVNWNTGNVFYQGVLQTLRVAFNDNLCMNTPSSSWVDKSPLTSQTTFDPILFTDRQTGETIVSQLGFNPIVGLSSVSFNDGDTWIPSQGSGINSGVDHQTVGGGPYHAPVPASQHAVYYCSQDLVMAQCALSADSGITYGPAVPIYTSECGGLHGHVKVGADGTVYVPNRGCKGPEARQQAVVVSEDNGATWQVRQVAGSLQGASDPSVAQDSGGRLYFGFIHNGHIPAVAISDDKGLTWRNLYDVGAQLGIQNAVFPAVVAADQGRAAFAFYGIKVLGTFDNFAFPPTPWHLYIAHTYDGGNSWITVDATPNDPLQRGGLHTGGGGDIHRNLLDFFDANVDAQGRVLVSYPRGCRDYCTQAADSTRGNSYGAFSTIARQSGGPRLIGAFDPPAASVPGAPRLTATRNGSLATLTWSQSDNGGLPISAYSVYRRAGTAPEGLLATLSGSATSYVDQSGDPRATYTYRVAATNSLGTSCGTNAFVAEPIGSSCIGAGLKILTSPTGNQIGAPANPDMDILWLSIAEPFFADGSRKLVFRLKVASLAPPGPNRMWRILWNYPDQPVPPNATASGFAGRYYLGMNTDATGSVSFEYGFAESLSLVVADAVPPVSLGTPDNSSFSPDGTITFTIATDKIGGPKAGDLLGGLVARTYPFNNQDLTLRSTGAADSASLGLTYKLVGNAFCQNPPPTVTCVDDSDPAINYSNAWHLVIDGNASGGGFHYSTGNNAGSRLSYLFSVSDGATGALVYQYGRSTRGGTADVFIDGAFRETISFLGTSGTNRDPQFGFSSRYSGLGAGAHTFELRNLQGPTFVDGFCLENSFGSSTAASTGPGTTTSALSTIQPALNLFQAVPVPAGAQAITVAAESSDGSPFSLLLLDPLGNVASTVSSVNGTAVIEQSVALAGAYSVKVVNNGLNPVQVWLLATPWGSR
jgi:hypothetical protein